MPYRSTGTPRQLLIDLILESEDLIHRGEYAIIQKGGWSPGCAETSAAKARGLPKIFLGKASLLYNKDGDVVGAIESIRDIMEARKSEDELRGPTNKSPQVKRELRNQSIDLEKGQVRLQEANEQNHRAGGRASRAV